MADFYECLAEVIERQYRLYEPYQALCEMEDVTLADLKVMVADHELWRVPAIPADWFKRHLSQGLFRKLARPEATGS